MARDSPLAGVNLCDNGSHTSTPSASAAARAARDVSEDELRRVLSDGRRRSIVAFLATEDGPVHRSAVVEHLAPTEAEQRRIATRLHHVHLPKLADAGLAVHDAGRDTLEAGANIGRALHVLTTAPDDPAPRS